MSSLAGIMSNRRATFLPQESQPMPDWQIAGREFIWMPYAQMQTEPLPMPVFGTDGVHITLADGRQLIDGMASWWTACHGYNHPHIADAVQRQLTTMPHIMFGGIHHEPALQLAQRLAELLPGDLNRVFFSDSGSVAVEVAMKMAVQFHRNRGDADRSRFVSFHNAYHGDTTGAMSLCDPVNSLHGRFRGTLLKQFSRPIPTTDGDFGEFESFLAAHAAQIAGVFLEPLVQGAGGMKFHSPETLRRIAEVCRRQETLFIADELATGFGRTGSMFAVEQANVVPDIICLGKALTGGTLGLAATVATDRVFEAFLSDDPTFALMHGPTFMANPLACAAANASLDLFEREPRMARAKEMEAELRTALEPCRGLPGVVDVRCKGAVGVVQVERLHHLTELRQSFIDAGAWVRPFWDIIYLTPALSMTTDELRTLGDTFVDVVRDWAAR